jgi:glyoxylase-like metal-dependent hydrolase (beta-lactamase superfamily II)
MYKQSLEKLAKLRVDIMLPGHGIFIMSNAYDHIEHALEKLSSIWKDFTPFSNPIRDKIVNQLLY